MVELISTTRHSDHQGFFVETYNTRQFLEIGLDVSFVQGNHSMSHKKNTLRGLHFQAPPHAQAELVCCVS